MSVDTNLALTESYLKLSDAVNMELIPADDNYLDKKEFTWSLSAYDNAGLGFRLKFKHPKYISINGADTLKIYVKNAVQFLNPQS